MQNNTALDDRLLLPGENPGEYRKHLDGLLASFCPRDSFERLLVEEFAAASWVWRRARAVEMQFLFQVGTSYNRGPDGIAEALFHVPDKYFRNFRHYMSDAERRYERARRAVDQIRRDRDRGAGVEEPVVRAATAPPECAVTASAAVARSARAEKRNEPNAADPALRILTKRTQLAQPGSSPRLDDSCS